jgi:CheY-like chemotaxis protein/transposase-like protein
MNRSIPLYSISAVAKTVGVPVATLRTWEDRYGLVVPERSSGRHRLYSQNQLDQLRFVKARMEEGASASEAHRLLRAGHHDVEPPAPVARTDPGNRPMILLAEHDPFAAEVEERLLKDQGYEVHVALGMEAASRALGQHAPALVVLDLLLSGGLGLEFCRALKERPQPPAVLAVSSLRSGDRAVQAGADSFLSKPLDPAEFTSVVNDLLRSNAALADSA